MAAVLVFVTILNLQKIFHVMDNPTDWILSRIPVFEVIHLGALTRIWTAFSLLDIFMHLYM